MEKLTYAQSSRSNLRKFVNVKGDTHQDYKHIASLRNRNCSNYFSGRRHTALVAEEDTTGEVLTITNNGQKKTIWSRYGVLGIKIAEKPAKIVFWPWLEFLGNKPLYPEPERAISQADQLLDLQNWSRRIGEIILVNPTQAKNKPCSLMTMP